MANGNSIEFQIPGRQAPAGTRETLGSFAKIEVREGFQVRPPMRGTEDLVQRKYAPETLIELQFENGATVFTRADQLAEDLKRRGRARSAATSDLAVMVPAIWDGSTRGDSERLAAFRVLDVSVWDGAIEEFARAGAEYGAQKIAAYFESHIKAGLFQTTDPRELGAEVIEPIPNTPERPILLSRTARPLSGPSSRLG